MNSFFNCKACGFTSMVVKITSIQGCKEKLFFAGMLMNVRPMLSSELFNTVFLIHQSTQNSIRSCFFRFPLLTHTCKITLADCFGNMGFIQYSTPSIILSSIVRTSVIPHMCFESGYSK